MRFSFRASSHLAIPHQPFNIYMFSGSPTFLIDSICCRHAELVSYGKPPNDTYRWIAFYAIDYVRLVI